MRAWWQQKRCVFDCRSYCRADWQKKALAKKELESKKSIVQADDLISFRQLSKKSAGGDVDDVSSVRSS